jgi:hypothetical protein
VAKQAAVAFNEYESVGLTPFQQQANSMVTREVGGGG